MSRPLSLMFTVAAALLSGACGSTMSSVKVNGADSDVTLLAGQWHGKYEGLQSGRRGTIEFDLQVGRHTAEGIVLMHMVGADANAIPLKISFVRVADGRVQGSIEPYTDPQCNCQVVTEFEGSVAGDAISGTFVSKLDQQDAAEQSGWWSVERATN